jgi:CubicO group peptidase (beta-lactamase class C family)
MIAPELVTRYSGMPFESFVSTRLLAPLNMSRTTYNYTAARAAGLAHGFLPSGRRVPNLYADPTFAHFAAGAGGLMASAADLARWAGSCSATAPRRTCVTRGACSRSACARTRSCRRRPARRRTRRLTAWAGARCATEGSG